MIIKNSEDQEIYNKRSNGNLDTDSIINAIVKAGGVDKIHVKLFDNGFTMNEFINSVRFLKSINFDINQLPIEQYKEYGGIELIKQGYDMYKLGEDNIPVITECGYGVLKECIKKGLDLNKFNKKNHFLEFIECDDNGEYLKKNYRISNFIRDKENPKFIDINKLDLLIDNGLLNNNTLSDLEGEIERLYYNCELLMLCPDDTFKKLVDAYEVIELNEKGLFEIDSIDTTGELKAHLLKRYLDTSKNKDVAISNIYRIFENSGGECLHEKTNKPTIEMINKYIKEEREELHSILSQSSTPKPSTRRRM
ncbi:hypothetical protein RFP21_003962 [Salmonella enterica]|nr:hypothetical protein [Salmonella enterica]EKD7209797.1 hypothetical protein [Salmonella enterica subsp. enterica serovar Liverpool]ELA4021747.1 hypothetical protein [Salmonella enterica]HCE0787410.1 hypothetical protein [Escherichia coli]